MAFHRQNGGSFSVNIYCRTRNQILRQVNFVNLFLKNKISPPKDNQSEMEQVKPDPTPELDEGKLIQINDWSAHDDVVKSIQFIAATDEPLVFTASLDRMAYIWDLHKNPKRKFPNRGALL